MIMSQAFLPFHCQTCSKVFPTRTDCNRHEKKHDKAYSCTFCSKAFCLQSDVERHRPTHLSPNFKFRCTFPECTFRGTYRVEYFLKHIKNRHKLGKSKRPEAILRKYYDEAQSTKADIQVDIDEQYLQLLESVYVGEEEKVKSLIAEGADVFSRSEEYLSTMAIAIDRGHTAVLRMLIEAAAKTQVQKQEKHELPYFLTYRGRSLLNHASCQANAAMIKIILEAILRAKADTNNHDSIFDSLAGKRLDAVVQIFIEHHDQTEYSSTYDAVLVAVAQGGDSILVRDILNHGTAERIARRYTLALYDAAARRDADQLLRVKTCNDNPLERPGIFQQAFRTAAQVGHAAVVHALLRDRASTVGPYDRDFAFQSATKGGHLPIMQMLLDDIARSSSKGQVLDLIAYYDPDRHVPWRSDNVDHRYGVQRVTSLHLVAISSPQRVNDFVGQGFDVNAKDSGMMTPLSYALGRNPFRVYFEKESVKENVAKMLLDAGAEISPEDLPFMSQSLRDKYSQQVIGGNSLQTT